MGKIFLKKVNEIRRGSCTGCYFEHDETESKTCSEQICFFGKYILEQIFPTPDEAAQIEARLKK
jgi:hypothetical protein